MKTDETETKYIARVHRFDGNVEKFECSTLARDVGEWFNIAADEGDLIAVARRYTLAVDQPDAPEIYDYVHAGKLGSEESGRP